MGPPRVQPPRPAVTAGPEDPGDGLLFAWFFPPSGHGSPLRLDQLDAALERQDGMLWVHVNATAQRAKHWVAGCRHLPEPIREDLLETDERTRLEPVGDAVLGVIGDTVAGLDPDPWRLSTLRFHLTRRALVSTRRRPVNCASKLGRAVREGLRVRSTAELVVWLMTYAADSVQARARELVLETDRAEDEVLSGHVTLARRRLGQTRRRAARLRRQVALRPRAIDRLRARLPAWLGEDDRYELLDVLDRMETMVDELAMIEQREAALEAEVAARLAEETNRNLYILSMVTVLFAPMTLITGIFGMNVAGLPGLADQGAFFWVMLAMAVTAAGFLAAMYWRRLF